MTVVTKLAVIACAAIFLGGCSSGAKDNGPQDQGVALAQQDSSFGWNVEPAAYEVREGKFLFNRYCAVCHGAGGAGDGFNAYNLDPKPHSLADSSYMAQISENSLKQVIELGGGGVNKSVLMPPYGHTLSKIQIQYLIAYIRGFTHSGT